MMSAVGGRMFPGRRSSYSGSCIEASDAVVNIQMLLHFAPETYHESLYLRV